jgi:hypothetical protein
MDFCQGRVQVWIWCQSLVGANFALQGGFESNVNDSIKEKTAIRRRVAVQRTKLGLGRKISRISGIDGDPRLQTIISWTKSPRTKILALTRLEPNSGTVVFPMFALKNPRYVFIL